MTNAIELTNVSKRFGPQIAVDDLSLNVPQGSIYGFIGPNGSGKTTTLRMILRIFQPDSGDVKVLGQSHGKTADDRLGYLPEERGLYKRMRVRALLKYYAQLKGFYDCQSEIDKWLERLQATAWSNKRIDMLSKGMAQKIQFISAVIAKPQLVILDEPFSGLDPVNLEVLRDAVFWLREQGATIVFSTHDMPVAEKMCDTIFMIFQGRKVLDGTLSSIQGQYPADRLRFAFAAADTRLSENGLVDDIKKSGPFIECRMLHPEKSQQILRHLADQGTLTHFEIIKPTLHEVFVRIAKPTATENVSKLVG
jgi:ABC-2 type transport system ATP-binding protein